MVDPTCSVSEAASEELKNVVDAMSRLPSAGRREITSALHRITGLDGKEIPTQRELARHVQALHDSGTLAGTTEAIEIVKQLGELRTEVGGLEEQLRKEEFERLPEVKLLRRFENLRRDKIAALRDIPAPSLLFGCSGMEISDRESEWMTAENAGREASFQSECEEMRRIKLEVKAGLTGIVLHPRFEKMYSLEQLKDEVRLMSRYQREEVAKLAKQIQQENEVDLSGFLRLIAC